jgi:hypothetical protein
MKIDTYLNAMCRAYLEAHGAPAWQTRRNRQYDKFRQRIIDEQKKIKLANAQLMAVLTKLAPVSVISYQDWESIKSEAGNTFQVSVK